MKQFEEMLVDSGFDPGFKPELTNGKWKEYKDPTLGKMGYIYEETPHEKGTVKRLVYRIFASGDQYNTITHFPDSFTDNDRKKSNGKFKENAFKIAESIREAHAVAASEAAAIIRNSPIPQREPAYLRNKGLSCLSGYYIDKENAETMHIPLYGNDGELASIQSIFPDGTKGFLVDGKIKGSYGFIQGGGDTIYFCEGFATAASIHQATAGTVVFVLSSDNYLEAIPNALRRFRSQFKVICADDDKHLQENIGFKKAFAAATKFNCMVKKPIFKNYKGKETTDYDDLRREEGIDAVKEQLTIKKEEKELASKKEGIFPLGHDDSVYYFTSTKNASIQGFSSVSKETLFKLMPEEWWEERYGEITDSGATIVHWDSVISDLYDQCHQIGKFSSNTMRGIGVYQDRGRTVVHLGDRLMVDGKECFLRGFDSQYTYIFDDKLPNIEPVPLTDEETKPLYDLMHSFNFEEKTAAIYVSGWIVCSILAGSLKWRPHLYIHGRRGTGKSTILNFINTMLKEGFFLHPFEATTCTPAGLKQTCGSTCVAVTIDEIESVSNKAAVKIEEFISIFRSASSNNGALSAVGTPGQKAIHSRTAFCGVMAGIVEQLKNDQDKSRFAVVEMAKSEDENRAEQWTYIKERINFCTTSEFSRRFVARIIYNSKIILENIETLTSNIMTYEEARLAQQYGALFAAALAIEHTNKISEEEIEKVKTIIKNTDSTISKSKEESSTDDLLEQILSAELFDEENKRTTVRRELAKQDQSEQVKQVMGEYGVIVCKKNGESGVQIRNTSKIRGQLKDLPMFSTNYMSVLKRTKGIQKDYVSKFQGKCYKGVWVPMSLIVEQDNTIPPETGF